MLNGLFKSGRPNVATFIGSGSGAVLGANAITIPGGAKSGDLFVGWVHGITSTLALDGVGLTPITADAGRFFVKPLTQAEITNGGTASSLVWWLVFRGPSSALLRAQGNAGGTGPTLTGFTKSQFSAALVEGGSANGATAQPTIPGPWTTLGYVQSSQDYQSAAYLLPSSGYTNGASIATGGSSNGTTSANILELIF